FSFRGPTLIRAQHSVMSSFRLVPASADRESVRCRVKTNFHRAMLFGDDSPGNSCLLVAAAPTRQRSAPRSETACRCCFTVVSCRDCGREQVLPHLPRHGNEEGGIGSGSPLPR